MGSVGVPALLAVRLNAGGGFLVSAKIRRLMMRAFGLWCARGVALLAGILAVASFAAPGWGQTFRGTILGTVTDSSGATVVGAAVTIKNVDTGLIRATVSTGDGTYSVPELPVGTYTVTIEQTGFQTSVTTGVTVDVSSERRVDATLKPGQMNQKVEVSSEALPIVETTSDTLGGTFEDREISDLPVNGRDYTKLLILVPGATGEPNGGGDSPGSYGQFSVNGSRGRANNYLL